MGENSTIGCRPFDLDAAAKGAPYCCRNGEPAKILKWDGKGVYLLIGIRGHHDAPFGWFYDGTAKAAHRAIDNHDLVMSPLGYVEGKPFFMGDIIVGASGKQFVAKPCDVDGGHDKWTWPKPETSAERTLRMLGYIDRSGEYWVPPEVK